MLTQFARSPEGRLALLALGTVITGTIFYHAVEGWSWVDALYFSTITLATVGYGDLHPTTDLSKLFTVGYLLFGLGIVAAFINMVAQRRIRRTENAAASNDSVDRS